MATDYSFLKEPLEAKHGYWPQADGGPVGRFIEPVLAATFGAWDVETPDDDEDLQSLKLLHGLAQTTWRGTVESIEQVRSDDDPSLNTDGRLKILGGIVEPKIERLATLAESEIGKAKASLDQVQADIAKAVRTADPIDVSVHASIRDHIRAQGGGLSVAAVYTAINDNDVQTLQAVATAPPYLSGLAHAAGREVHARAQAAVAAALAPALTARAQALQTGMAKAAQALSALNANINRTIDLKKARALRERAKSYAA